MLRRGRHRAPTALVVKDDKSSNPIDVGLLRTNAVVLEADAFADACEETRRFWGVHREGFLGSTI